MILDDVYHKESLIFRKIVCSNIKHKKEKIGHQSQDKIKLNEDAKVLIVNHIYLRHIQMKTLNTLYCIIYMYHAMRVFKYKNR